MHVTLETQPTNSIKQKQKKESSEKETSFQFPIRKICQTLYIDAYISCLYIYIYILVHNDSPAFFLHCPAAIVEARLNLKLKMYLLDFFM